MKTKQSLHTRQCLLTLRVFYTAILTKNDVNCKDRHSQLDIYCNTLVHTQGSWIHTFIVYQKVIVNKTVPGNRMVAENKTIRAHKTVVINVASFLHSNTEEK